jgi:long-chain fatty acid transport protein
MKTMHQATTLMALCAILASTNVVTAGGYDTPILYSARHMGMGGTAIGYVNDPSALFHNPAGLSHTRFISLTANVSPLFGSLQSSPDNGLLGPAVSTRSEPAFAPFFLVGGSFRVTDWMTFGMGAYPVASAGAEYKYENKKTGNITTDKTELVFIEITPAVSFDLPGNLRIGAGYRFSIASLERFKGGGKANPALLDTLNTSKYLDLDLKGLNFAGFRAGLQWQPIPELQLGVTYRHKTTTTLEGDSSNILYVNYGKTSMDVVLPSKLGAGVRYDAGPLGLALDFEWTFNSQNGTSTLHGESLDGNTNNDQAQPLPSEWSDAMTVRIGTEYKLMDNYRIRMGYIFDDKTGNEKYPTAFGTPPTPTHSMTAGFGYEAENWETNVAYAYRFGSTSVDSPTEDPDAQLNLDCPACSWQGDYAINLHGVYVDFSWYFE